MERPIARACSTSRSSTYTSARSNSSPWHIAYVNGSPRGTRTWPINFAARPSPFRRTSLRVRADNASRQGQALHDRKGFGDGVCFAPRRHASRRVDRRRPLHARHRVARTQRCHADEIDRPVSVHGVDHDHDIVPVHERVHHHGGAHDHGHDHGHGDLSSLRRLLRRHADAPANVRR